MSDSAKSDPSCDPSLVKETLHGLKKKTLILFLFYLQLLRACQLQLKLGCMKAASWGLASALSLGVLGSLLLLFSTSLEAFIEPLLAPVSCDAPLRTSLAVSSVIKRDPCWSQNWKWLEAVGEHEGRWLAVRDPSCPQRFLLPAAQS